jgi:hypothetical protein
MSLAPSSRSRIRNALHSGHSLFKKIHYQYMPKFVSSEFHLLWSLRIQSFPHNKVDRSNTYKN